MAEKLLKDAGYEVVNPTKFFICRHLWAYRMLGYVPTLLYDLWRLSRCDLIYKIPGWQQSKGANVESCWAWHFKIWQPATKYREQMDKKMAKLIVKQEMGLDKER